MRIDVVANVVLVLLALTMVLVAASYRLMVSVVSTKSSAVVVAATGLVVVATLSVGFDSEGGVANCSFITVIMPENGASALLEAVIAVAVVLAKRDGNDNVQTPAINRVNVKAAPKAYWFLCAFGLVRT
jgi:hypothetical protein